MSRDEIFWHVFPLKEHIGLAVLFVVVVVVFLA